MFNLRYVPRNEVGCSMYDSENNFLRNEAGCSMLNSEVHLVMGSYPIGLNRF